MASTARPGHSCGKRYSSITKCTTITPANTNDYLSPEAFTGRFAVRTLLIVRINVGVPNARIIQLGVKALAGTGMNHA